MTEQYTFQAYQKSLSVNTIITFEKVEWLTSPDIVAQNKNLSLRWLAKIKAVSIAYLCIIIRAQWSEDAIRYTGAAGARTSSNLHILIACSSLSECVCVCVCVFWVSQCKPTNRQAARRQGRRILGLAKLLALFWQSEIFSPLHSASNLF